MKTYKLHFKAAKALLKKGFYLKIRAYNYDHLLTYLYAAMDETLFWDIQMVNNVPFIPF